MLQTHPDVILTETIGSAGTYMEEVKQQNGGKMIPFIGTSATIDPVWFQQVVDAIGIDGLSRQLHGGVTSGYSFSGAGLRRVPDPADAATRSTGLQRAHLQGRRAPPSTCTTGSS